MRGRRLWVLGAGSVFLVLGAWVVFGRQPTEEFRTETVNHGDINVTVSATGNPNAVVTVQVGSQVSGTILALSADFNTKVAKGQLIARIDPAPFQAKVDQAHANLDAARASSAESEIRCTDSNQTQSRQRLADTGAWWRVAVDSSSGQLRH